MRDRILNAKQNFSPKKMMEHLKRGNDGVVYFDRATKVTDNESGAEFYYMLNGYYNAGWGDIGNLTAYFEIVGDEIFAGGYNIVTGEKTSRRRLISTNEKLPYTAYTYTEEEIENLKEKILSIDI